MPVYSGLHYYTSFNGGATRTALADAIKVALVSAGWTVASGSSGDWKLDSGITPNGLQCRVRVWDPGSGTAAQVQSSNIAESVVLSGAILHGVFNAAETWEFYGNPYCAIMQVIPWPSTAGKLLAFGTGWTPEFFHNGSPNECIAAIFQTGNTLGRISWNVGLCGSHYATIWNAGKVENASDAGHNTRLHIPILWNTSRTDLPVSLKWAVDDSLHVGDPLLVWSAITPFDQSDARVRLILYDALVVQGQYEAGDEITFNGFVWRAITHNYALGTLFCLKAEFSPA